MKKLVSVSAAALLAVPMFTATALSADLDLEQELGLVVSGEIDRWSGYTFISDVDGDAGGLGAFPPTPDDYFAAGLNGRLSLPLGDTLSAQMDAYLEYTENALDSGDTNEVFLWSSQFGFHLSARDPRQGLIGGFASFGLSSTDFDDQLDFVAAGGEAQAYLGDVTLYVQAGYLDSTHDDEPEDSLQDAFFVRGVGRWFPMPNSRLQLEASYASGDQDEAGNQKDLEIIEWIARYDTLIEGLPLIGDTNVYVAYRGANFEISGDPTDFGEYTDHTFMIGSVFQFGGDNRRMFDLIGATLDLPQFGRWVAAGDNAD